MRRQYRGGNDSARATTMMLLASAFLIGVALSRRYNVFLLVLTSFFGASAILVFGIAVHGSIWENLFVATSTIVGLQIGYFAGMVVVTSIGGRPNIVNASGTSIENVHDRDDVVHFRKYWLAKIQ